MRFVPSRTSYGMMVDFLRANSWCSRDEYMWVLSVPQIALMSVDFSRERYVGDGKKKGGVRGIAGIEEFIE